MATIKRKRARTPPSWVGWREWVALPELDVERIKAKIDTGAATSSLHAIHIRRVIEDGRTRLSFEIHPEQRLTSTTVRCTADLAGERVVTSSNGHREKRPVIRTPLIIGARRYSIELTLTNRDTMGFRMLIGRRSMRGRLLVDPSGSYLAGSGDGPPR